MFNLAYNTPLRLSNEVIDPGQPDRRQPDLLRALLWGLGTNMMAIDTGDRRGI